MKEVPKSSLFTGATNLEPDIAAKLTINDVQKHLNADPGHAEELSGRLLAKEAKRVRLQADIKNMGDEVISAAMRLVTDVEKPRLSTDPRDVVITPNTTQSGYSVTVKEAGEGEGITAVTHFTLKAAGRKTGRGVLREVHATRRVHGDAKFVGVDMSDPDQARRTNATMSATLRGIRSGGAKTKSSVKSEKQRQAGIAKAKAYSSGISPAYRK